MPPPKRPFTTSSLTSTLKSTIASQPLLSNLTNIDKLSSQASSLAQKTPFFGALNQQLNNFNNSNNQQQQQQHNVNAQDHNSLNQASSGISNSNSSSSGANTMMMRGAGTGFGGAQQQQPANNNSNSRIGASNSASQMPASTPTVDMSHLTEEERLMIQSVMAKAEMADKGMPVDTSIPSSTNLPSHASQVLAQQTMQSRQQQQQSMNKQPILADQQQQQQHSAINQQQVSSQQLQQQQLNMHQQQQASQQQNQQNEAFLLQQQQQQHLQQQQQPPMASSYMSQNIAQQLQQQEPSLNVMNPNLIVGGASSAIGQQRQQQNTQLNQMNSMSNLEQQTQQLVNQINSQFNLTQNSQDQQAKRVEGGMQNNPIQQQQQPFLNQQSSIDPQARMFKQPMNQALNQQQQLFDQTASILTQQPAQSSQILAGSNQQLQNNNSQMIGAQQQQQQLQLQQRLQLQQQQQQQQNQLVSMNLVDQLSGQNVALQNVNLAPGSGVVGETEALLNMQLVRQQQQSQLAQNQLQAKNVRQEQQGNFIASGNQFNASQNVTNDGVSIMPAGEPAQQAAYLGQQQVSGDFYQQQQQNYQQADPFTGDINCHRQQQNNNTAGPLVVQGQTSATFALSNLPPGSNQRSSDIRFSNNNYDDYSAHLLDQQQAATLSDQGEFNQNGPVRGGNFASNSPYRQQQQTNAPLRRHDSADPNEYRGSSSRMAMRNNNLYQVDSERSLQAYDLAHNNRQASLRPAYGQQQHSKPTRQLPSQPQHHVSSMSPINRDTTNQDQRGDLKARSLRETNKYHLEQQQQQVNSSSKHPTSRRKLVNNKTTPQTKAKNKSIQQHQHQHHQSFLSGSELEEDNGEELDENEDRDELDEDYDQAEGDDEEREQQVLIVSSSKTTEKSSNKSKSPTNLLNNSSNTDKNISSEQQDTTIRLFNDLKLNEQASQVMEQQQLLIKQSQELIKLQLEQQALSQELKKSIKTTDENKTIKTKEISTTSDIREKKENVDELKEKENDSTNNNNNSNNNDNFERGKQRLDENVESSVAKYKQQKSSSDLDDVNADDQLNSLDNKSSSFKKKKKALLSSDNNNNNRSIEEEQQQQQQTTTLTNKSKLRTQKSTSFCNDEMSDDSRGYNKNSYNDNYIEDNEDNNNNMTRRKGFASNEKDKNTSKKASTNMNNVQASTTTTNKSYLSYSMHNNNNNNNTIRDLLQSPTDTTDSDFEPNHNQTKFRGHNHHQQRIGTNQHHNQYHHKAGQHHLPGGKVAGSVIQKRREPTGLPPSPLPVAAAIQLHQMQQQHFKNQQQQQQIFNSKNNTTNRANFLRSRSVTSSPNHHLENQYSGYLTDHNNTTLSGGLISSRLIRSTSPDTLSEFGGMRRRKRLPEPPTNAVPLTPSMVRKMIQAQRAGASGGANTNKLLTSVNAQSTLLTNTHLSRNIALPQPQQLQQQSAGITTTTTTSSGTFGGTGAENYSNNLRSNASASSSILDTILGKTSTTARLNGPAPISKLSTTTTTTIQNKQQPNELNKFLSSTYGNSILRNNNSTNNVISDVKETPELDKLISNLDEYYGLDSTNATSSGGSNQIKRHVRLSEYRPDRASYEASHLNSRQQQQQPQTSFSLYSKDYGNQTSGGSYLSRPSYLSNNSTTTGGAQQQQPTLTRCNSEGESSLLTSRLSNLPYSSRILLDDYGIHNYITNRSSNYSSLLPNSTNNDNNQLSAGSKYLPSTSNSLMNNRAYKTTSERLRDFQSNSIDNSIGLPLNKYQNQFNRPASSMASASIGSNQPASYLASATSSDHHHLLDFDNNNQHQYRNNFTSIASGATSGTAAANSDLFGSTLSKAQDTQGYSMTSRAGGLIDHLYNSNPSMSTSGRANTTTSAYLSGGLQNDSRLINRGSYLAGTSTSPRYQHRNYVKSDCLDSPTPRRMQFSSGQGSFRSLDLSSRPNLGYNSNSLTLNQQPLPLANMEHSTTAGLNYQHGSDGVEGLFMNSNTSGNNYTNSGRFGYNNNNTSNSHLLAGQHTTLELGQQQHQQITTNSYPTSGLHQANQKQRLQQNNSDYIDSSILARQQTTNTLASSSNNNNNSRVLVGSNFAPLTKDDIINSGPKFDSIGYRFRTDNQNKYVAQQQATASVQCLQSRYPHPYKRILLSKNPKDRIGHGIGVRITGGQPMPSLYDKVNRCIVSSGAFVTDVFQNSNVHFMGEMKEGDQIIEWNGVNLCNRSNDEVQQILLSQFSDDEVEIVYLQQNKFHQAYAGGLNAELYNERNSLNNNNDENFFHIPDQFDQFADMNKSGGTVFSPSGATPSNAGRFSNEAPKGSIRRKISLSSLSHMWK